MAAYLVRERALGWAMVGGGLVYFGLSLLGVDWFRCPFLGLTGSPCPGCGMTRSCLALLHGDWAGVWRFHPFGPVFAVFWAVVGAGLLLPRGARAGFADRVGRIERWTKWPLWVLTALLIYSLTRWIHGG